MQIQIKNISKAYGDHAVLQDVSLDLQPQVCNVLMAPSGAGKTTLLRILMGLEEADSGQVCGMPERFSAVFQEDRLCEEMTVMANLLLVLPIASKKEKEKILSHLTSVGLLEDAYKIVGTLSGGMKRRVSLVRAILVMQTIEDGLLILDEPFAGLDVATKEKVLLYFEKETRGYTTLLVTHDTMEAQRLGKNRCAL